MPKVICDKLMAQSTWMHTVYMPFIAVVDIRHGASFKKDGSISICDFSRGLIHGINAPAANSSNESGHRNNLRWIMQFEQHDGGSSENNLFDGLVEILLKNIR